MCKTEFGVGNKILLREGIEMIIVWIPECSFNIHDSLFKIVVCLFVECIMYRTWESLSSEF